MARKRRWLDRKLMKELACAQLTTEEMARCLRCSKDTLERRYLKAIQAWKATGVAKMRRRLFTVGLSDEKSSVAAMIFFLKNYGGMADHQVVEDKSGVKDRGELPSHFAPKPKDTGAVN